MLIYDATCWILHQAIKFHLLLVNMVVSLLFTLGISPHSLSSPVECCYTCGF